jgi:hypothetical protein
MAKSPSKTSTTRKTGKAPASRQFIDDPDKLLKAILKAVGSLRPGEGLEIRRVREPKSRAPKPAKKKPTAVKSPTGKTRP